MRTRVVAALLAVGCAFAGVAVADQDISRLLFEGRAAYRIGDYAAAERWHRLAVEAAETQGDPLLLAEAVGDLGGSLLAQGRYQEARQHSLRALNILQTNKSERHLRVVLNNLGVLSMETRDFAQSEEYFKQAIKAARKITSPDVHEGRAWNNLGTLYYGMQDYGRAEKTFKEALKVIEKRLGTDNEELAPVLSNLGGVYVTRKKWNSAEPLLARALTLLQDTTIPSNRLRLAGVLDNIGMMQHTRENFKEAEAVFRKCYEIRLTLLGKEHSTLALTGVKLGLSLTAMERFDEAERLYAEAQRIYEAKASVRPLELLATLDATAALFRKTNRPEAAEVLENRAETMRNDLNQVVSVAQLR